MTLLTRLKEGIEEYRIPKEDIMRVIERKYGSTQTPVTFDETQYPVPEIEKTIKSGLFSFSKPPLSQKLFEHQLKDVPLSDDVKKIIPEIKFGFELKAKFGGNLIRKPAGRDTFGFIANSLISVGVDPKRSEKIAGWIADTRIAQKFDKPNVILRKSPPSDLETKEAFLHEVLHEYFDKSPMS
ncbi:MAG: hypothetical protein Q8Q96_01080, partial [bacterium]|nr:hypothetical protein [bacterium]